MTFKVGLSESIYYIHDHIICCESSVFKMALNSEFKEGKTKEIVLDDTDEQVFEIIMHWAYTHELPGPNSEQKWKVQMREDEDGDEVETTWDFLLSSAYVFAKRYDMPLLASGIHCLFEERFRTWESKCPRLATVARVSYNVPMDSWLCQIFVDQISAFWDRRGASDEEKKYFQYLPDDIIERVFNGFATVRDQLVFEAVEDSKREDSSA